MIFIRSTLWLVYAVLFSLAWFILFLPSFALPRRVVVYGAHLWAKHILWTLKILCGVRHRVSGDIGAARGPVLIAAKHQSTWETIAVCALLPDPAIVLKRELFRIPLYGWYGIKQEMIGIDRGAGARAVRHLVEQSRRALRKGRPIVIFPEGTRVKPGAPTSYKPGIAGLYNHLGVPCVPVAHNAGLCWTGYRKVPGLITIEFLEPIPPGLERGDFMKTLFERIEPAARNLLTR